MSKIGFLEGIARKLSMIPGLRFLEEYSNDIRASKTRMDQTVGDYQAYAQSAKDAATDVKDAASGKSQEEQAVH